MMPDPMSYTEADLRDPSIDANTLRQIAEQRPDLRDAVLRHPNCYEALSTWIGQQPPATPSMAPPSALSGQQPAPPQTDNPYGGAQPQPTAEADASAPEAGAQPSGGETGESAGQQLADGAKQLADGAKDIFTNRIAPGAANAAQSMRTALNAQASRPGGIAANWMGWAPFVMIGAGLLGFIALFLPAVSILGESISFIGLGGDGVLLLFLTIAVVVLGVLSIVKPAKWSHLSSCIVAAVTGLFATIDGFRVAGVTRGASFGGFQVAHAGFGSILLGIMGVLMIASAVVMFIAKRQRR